MFYCLEHKRPNNGEKSLVRMFYTGTHKSIKNIFFEDFDKHEWPNMTIEVYATALDARAETNKLYTYKFNERGTLIRKFGK